jgi:hypothetical protein
MTRSSVAVLTLAAALFVAVAGCREEPTIVIKFEPNDLAGKSVASPSTGKPGDMAALAAAAAAPDLGVAKKPAAPTKAEGKTAAECKVAADCVVEPLDCCDCANGGKQHAIAKRQAAAAKAARAERCKTAVCTMMLSTDPSCGQRADCVDGRCVMVKK